MSRISILWGNSPHGVGAGVGRRGHSNVLGSSASYCKVLPLKWGEERTCVRRGGLRGDQPRRQELITEINMLGRNNWNWISLKEEIIDMERKYTPVNPMVLH